MDRELPPLPEPAFFIDCNDEPRLPVYTDDQMRTYAEEAVKQERRLVAAEVRQFLDRRCLRVER